MGRNKDGKTGEGAIRHVGFLLPVLHLDSCGMLSEAFDFSTRPLVERGLALWSLQSCCLIKWFLKPLIILPSIFFTVLFFASCIPLHWIIFNNERQISQLYKQTEVLVFKREKKNTA